MRLNVVTEVLNWLCDILPNQNWYAVFFPGLTQEILTKICQYYTIYPSGSGRKLDNPKPLNLFTVCGVSKIQIW
jgi:hypothetical protein